MNDDRWDDSLFHYPKRYQSESDGQLTIFEDPYDEAPDPSDYPDHESFDQAWNDWEDRQCEENLAGRDESEDSSISLESIELRCKDLEYQIEFLLVCYLDAIRRLEILEGRLKIEDSSILPTEQDNIELSSGSLNVYFKKQRPYYRFSYYLKGKQKHLHLCPAKPLPKHRYDLIYGIKRKLSEGETVDQILSFIEWQK